MSEFPAVTLEQIFAFEANLESGFQALLTAGGLPNVHSSRSRDVFESPFIALWVQNGSVNEGSQFAIQGLDGNLNPFAAYGGTLTTECVTNRSDNQPAHTLLIAQMRLALQMFRLYPIWPRYQTISLIADIRESGTIDTWEDEQNLDHTTITWSILHAINKSAWPLVAA